MKKATILGIIVLAILSSCNYIQGGGTELPTITVNPVDALRTSAAKTVDALSTALAVNKSPIPPAFTSTVQATIPLIKTQTLPAITAVPSFTAPPSKTSTPSNTPIPCDQVALVKDVTVPDGTNFYPNTIFIKTWELKNTGSCAWNSSYSLVFIEGALMKSPASKPLVSVGVSVVPGQTLQVSVEMTSPGTEGKHSGLWKLKNPKGEVFGVGTGGLKSFWVEINVGQKFTLLDNLCSAEWRNASEGLPCEGKVSDAKGSVTKDSQPKFIGGYVEDEPGILLIPQAVTDGVIVGKFPPMLIPAKSTLKSLLVCAFNSPKCDARVILTAQEGSLAEVTLLDVVKTAANDASPVSIDLVAKGLVGKSIVFRLYVKANGAATDDRIYWINPKLVIAP